MKLLLHCIFIIGAKNAHIIQNICNTFVKLIWEMWISYGVVIIVNKKFGFCSKEISRHHCLRKVEV